MDLAREPDFEIGALKVSPPVRQAIHSGQSETIEPRVLLVLITLAKRRGTVVSRDQLIEACWDGLAVSEDAINRCISKLRRLGEASGAYQLETITKVGYRLVEKAATPSALAPAPTTGTDNEPPSQPTRPDRRWLLASAIGGGAVVAGAATWFGIQSLQRPSQPSRADELYRRAIEVGANDNPAEVARSISFLRQAVELEPGHADAWAALALAYVFSFATNPEDRHAALTERARDAANRALALDSGNADAMAALAMMQPIYGRWGEAETRLRDVKARGPRLAPIAFALGEVLGATGRLREAIPLAEAAVTQTPLVSRRQYELAIYYWYAGRIEDADRTIAKAHELWPLDISVWFGRLYTRMYGGDFRSAIAMLDDEAARPRGIPPSDFELVRKGAIALQTGTAADRQNALDANVAAAPEGLGYARNAALLAGALGDLDAAFDFANAYFFGRPFAVAQQYFTAQQGEYLGVRSRETLFLFGPQMKTFRVDPRFEQLAAETGLAAYWRDAGVEPDFRRG